jgi:competence protein ComEC
MRGRAACWLICAFALVVASDVSADVVVPSPDVVTRVIVRLSASSQSAEIGSLRPGEQVELIGSVPNWHEVRLPNGSSGFVSKRWTRVVPTAAPPPTPPPVVAAPSFTLDVVDVGTGLGILLRGPDFTLIYDGGSNDDRARGPSNRMAAFIRAVAPTLTTIDHLILSHPHRDHVELLPDVFGAYVVRHVWDSGRINDICGYRAFLTAVRDEPEVEYHNALQDFGSRNYAFGAKTNGCYGNPAPAVTLTLTQTSRIDESPVPLGQHTSMTFLHADGGNHSSANENSLVVRLDLETTRVLLMGDAEAGGRAAPATPPSPSSIEGVLVTCCASALAADVLVVGHHGSRTSSRTAFLDAVGASVFVVSSGPFPYGNNQVVLPDADVIAELDARGEVFRTDTNDADCAMNPAKIGPDADGEPGGCDNIRVVIGGTPAVQVSVFQGNDS